MLKKPLHNQYMRNYKRMAYCVEGGLLETMIMMIVSVKTSIVKALWLCPHASFSAVRKGSGVSSSYEGTNPIGLGLHPYDLSCL